MGNEPQSSYSEPRTHYPIYDATQPLPHCCCKCSRSRSPVLGAPNAHPEQKRHLQFLNGAGDIVHVDGVDDDGRRGEKEEEEEQGGVDGDKSSPPTEAADGQVFPGKGRRRGAHLGQVSVHRETNTFPCMPAVGLGLYAVLTELSP